MAGLAGLGASGASGPGGGRALGLVPVASWMAGQADRGHLG